MIQPKKSVPEAGVQELLSDEIGRLVMRADRVERREVEALVMRVKTPRTECALGARQSRKTEALS